MNLTPADLELHASLGIDAELLRRAGVCRVGDLDAGGLLSINGKPGDYSGVVYPYHNPVTGRTPTLRLRRDTPDADGKKKYLAPFGDLRALYFPPGVTAELLADITVPVVPVES